MSLPRKALAVVFDLDGTLIDSEALVKEAFQTVCPRFGADMSDAHFLSLVGLHRDANDAQMLRLYGAGFPLVEFHEAARAHIGERVAPLKAGARELMDLLDGLGLRYGLATSSRPPWVVRHFTAHGLTNRFSAVITREDVLAGKPDPEPYVRASAILRTPPGDVLALEDSYAGVASAHGAGCMTIMTPDLLAPNDEMRAKADYIADTLHDVVTLMRAAYA
jgi:HAD superfamily hydrolase (TIGR01509 family)